MILRPPVIEDVPWIYEAYQDWPPTPEKGYPTFDKVEGWVRRWIHRTDEVCLVGETEVPVGLIFYRQNTFYAYVDNLVVHPDHRGRGNARELIALLTEHLFARGVSIAQFKTLSGTLRDTYGPLGTITALG